MNDVTFDQLATDMGRLADAMEIIARHLAPEAAKSLGHRKLPNLRRPLADYATFDWSSIGAKIVATDRSGPTEVDYHGTVCKRRSGEDKKGKAIWFNVVSGGTVADGNVTYERLISFRDGTPAEPLGDKVGAIVDASRARLTVPVTAQPAIEHGSAVAVSVAPTTPLQPSLYDQLVAAHSEVLRMCNTVPIQYQVERTDKPADMQRKLEGLRAMIANKDCGQVEHTPEERAAYAKVCKEHADLIQWAEQHKVEIPPLQRIQPADDTAHIEMKISTLSKLIAPSKAAAAAPGMRAELDKSRQSAPAQPTQPDLLKGQTMTPDQVRAWIGQRVKRGDQTRYNNTRERGQAIEAINAVTDGKAAQIVRKLFNAEIDQLNSAQTLAMFEWIKPAKQTPAGQPPTMLPANINAAAELAALLTA